MSIKILGGKLSGLSLYVPKGSQTRPTSVMLRRKIFDAHQDLSGKLFYDLCAGTGAMGLEACSRGAFKVVFVESHSKTFISLKQNIKAANDRLKNCNNDCDLVLNKSKLQSYASQFKKDYFALNDDEKESTILFVDPPYDRIEIYEFFLKEVVISDWFRGVSWIESDNKKGLLASWWEERGVKVKKIYQQGDSTLLITL